MDDMGMVRLQGVVVDSATPNTIVRADVTELQTNRTLDQNFIETQMNIDLSNVNVKKSNLYNWTFAINNGNLAISDPQNTISRTVPVNRVTYNKSGIYNKTTGAPLTLTSQQKSNSLIRFPYVIEVDRYLPVFRIYDQQKILLAEHSVLNPALGHSLD